MKSPNPIIPLVIPLFLLFVSPAASAAPSGGPYGPRHQRYEIPTNAASVVYVSSDGNADATGASLDTPTSLERAVKNATTGTVIVMRGGVYRIGNLEFNQGLTLQPYQSENVVLKGTQIATDWESHREGYWRVKWDALFPSVPQDWWRREREGMLTPPWVFNNDMVFRDGKLLQAKGWEGDLDANSYVIDYEHGYVYVAFDPTDSLVEITAWDNALLRTIEPVNGKTNDHVGPVIKGITLMQYAYRAIEIEGIEPVGPQEPGTYGGDVVGTTLEDVTIRYCSRVAGYFRGDNMVFRHCLISDTGTEGLYIIGSANALLERNIVTHTNIEPITGYFASAVKIFNQSDHVVVRDNLIIDNPDSSGVWWDVGNDHAVFINNWVENTPNGFFFEISQMAICAGNVFVNCPKGIWALNSRDVEIYHNTLVNSQIAVQRTPRSAANDHFGWHPATGPDVDERQNHIITHNLVVASPEFKDPMVWVWQTPDLVDSLTQPQVKELHSNVLIREMTVGADPIVLPSVSLAPVAGATDGSKTYDTLEALRSDFPAFAAETEIWTPFYGETLVNTRLHNLSLRPCFPGNEAVDSTPAKIRALLNLPEEGAIRRGAYPEGNM